MKRKPLVLALGAALVLLSGGLLFTWLNRGPARDTTVSANQTDERYELRPPASGESVRKHFIDKNGRETRTEVIYQNGDSSVTRLYPNGNMQEFRRTNKDGKIVLLQEFAPDGKTIVGGEEHRDDGTMKVLIKKTIDGQIKTTTYWYDGKAVFSITLQKMTGAYETTYYRKSGSVSGRRNGPKTGVVGHEEFCDKNGKLNFVRERNGDKVIVTVYSGNTRPTHRQTWVEEKNSWGGSSKRLTQVEEFDTDGKTVKRKIIYDTWRTTPTETWTYNWDGSAVVRKLRYDGTVESEETRDTAGNVSDHKDHSADENLRDDVDYSRTSEPWIRDPVEGWDLQERYPYYRTQDE